MKSYARVNDVKIQNILSIASEMKTLERFSSIYVGCIENFYFIDPPHCVLLTDQNASCWSISAVSAGSLLGLKIWSKT